MAIVEETQSTETQEAAAPVSQDAPEIQVQEANASQAPDDMGLDELVAAGSGAMASDETEGPSATEQTEPSQETPSSPSLIERMQQMGFEELQDEGQAIDRLLDFSTQQMSQMQQMQEQLAAQQTLAQYGQQYLSQAQVPQQQPQEEESSAVEQAWNPPEYNKAATERWLERDENGRVKWKEGTPDEVKQSTESYIQYLENFKDSFETNPDSEIRRLAMPWVREEIQNAINGYQEQLNYQAAQQQNLAFADHVFSQNKEWIYEKDPRTNEPLQDATGRYVFTPHGSAAVSHVQHLIAAGCDPQTAWNYGIQATAAQMLPNSASVAQQPTAAEIADQKKLQHLTAGANSISPRGGSLANPAEDSQVQNPRQTPGQSFYDQLSS